MVTCFFRRNYSVGMFRIDFYLSRGIVFKKENVEEILSAILLMYGDSCVLGCKIKMHA